MKYTERAGTRAIGKWPSILAALGVPPEALRNRHGPCPLGCKGKKSFRFDDKGGSGSWICTHCGAGDGLGLVMRYTGLPLGEAVKRVESLLPQAVEGKVAKPKDYAREMQRIRRVWQGAAPLEANDAVGLYLRRRLGYLPQGTMLRCHPGLPYYDGEALLGNYPTMIAAVWLGNRVVGLHRTYLTSDGHKAPVPMAKKLMTCVESIAGAAIRLSPADAVMGVAEGIESALAAAGKFKMPVWAAISTSGMVSFEPPVDARSVTVFADNDRNGAGQLAAYSLMNRLMTRTDILSSVVMPETPGTDWAD
jgi:putative DNA primase/helicase